MCTSTLLRVRILNIILQDPADDAMLDLAIAECQDKKQAKRLRAVRYALNGCEPQEIDAALRKRGTA